MSEGVLTHCFLKRKNNEYIEDFVIKNIFEISFWYLELSILNNDWSLGGLVDLKSCPSHLAESCLLRAR